MRHFFLLIFFIPLFSSAQDTTKQKFILSINAGTSFPERAYGVPKDIYNYNFDKDVYGYALGGVQFSVTAIYMTSSKEGLAGRFGMNINSVQNNYRQPNLGADILYQYMGGLYLYTGPTGSIINVYFIGLVGLVSANIPNSDNRFSGEAGGGIQSYFGYEVPGTGYGAGAYGGVGLTANISKHAYFDISAGYLSSSIDFPKGTLTTFISYFPNPPSTQGTSTTGVSQYDMKMSIGVIQVNLGVSFHI